MSILFPIFSVSSVPAVSLCEPFFEVFLQTPVSPCEPYFRGFPQTPCALTFSGEHRGKTVYIAAAWQNERGNVGQYSEILSAVIP